MADDGRDSWRLLLDGLEFLLLFYESEKVLDFLLLFFFVVIFLLVQKMRMVKVTFRDLDFLEVRGRDVDEDDGS